MAKTSREELRVFINGERVGGESISLDVDVHGLVIDNDDLGWMVERIDVREVDGHIEVHATMPPYSAMLSISHHRYCEHPVTRPAGAEAEAGRILMELRRCEECGRIIHRPYELGVS